uniref:hypothetical protein n=1 Tax=Gemmiger formicilis TaxID=745368 RepID=UPI003FEF8779
LFSFCNKSKKRRFSHKKQEKPIETHVFCNYVDGICAACTKTTVFLGYFTSGQNEKSFLK